MLLSCCPVGEQMLNLKASVSKRYFVFLYINYFNI